MTMVTDDQLVERTLGGEEDAFEQLVRTYQAAIYYLALRFVKDEQAAADLSQMTFLRAFQGLPQFRKTSSSKTWLYRIAINLCKNYLRDNGRMNLQQWGEIAPPASSGPMQEVLEHEGRRRLLEAVNRLPHRQRLTLLLKVQENMKYTRELKLMGCLRRIAVSAIAPPMSPLPQLGFVICKSEKSHNPARRLWRILKSFLNWCLRMKSGVA